MSQPSRFLVLLAAFALAGAGCRPAPVPQAFGTSNTFTVGQTIVYEDGISVELKSISDSRCKPDVQCIWAGELAPVFQIQGGNFGVPQEIQLGTVRAQTQAVGVYTFTLGDVSTKSAAVIVGKIL